MVTSRAEAIEFTSSYAPQCLIIHVKDPETYVDYIDNTGAVYLGPWSPPGVVDYAVRALLPTNGWTRTFTKWMKRGYKPVGANVTTMAEMDGLHAHKKVVTMRIDDLNV
ncbi:hypothetical protein SSX86_018377 [Deinandra increscens subsp. villosa]|uniref:Uncharacterized protein n=1 Tax=Deinandra increscens subsp. villosa TaxID=3103831 RepID=A0AAP0GUL8_9ASTR